MRYVCLLHFAPDQLARLLPVERRGLTRRAAEYESELRDKGHYIAGGTIESADRAVLVRVREERTATADGPHEDPKEQMAGFIVIEARDMNEALGLAARIPLAEVGTVELRPAGQLPGAAP